jgi:lysophospholipase L1-like esterase
MTRPLAASLLLALAASVALGACDSRPPLPRLAADAVVLAFGDSLTHGTGAAPSESYPAALERSIQRTVVARGVPGELSGGGLARFAGTLDDVKPALVLLCHGGNDFLRKLDERQLAANLRAMIQAARERRIPVVVIGVPKPGLWLSTASLYRDLAKEFGLPYEGKALERILGDNALKSDPVHPNAQGYATLAAAVAALLREYGAVP